MQLPSERRPPRLLAISYTKQCFVSSSSCGSSFTTGASQVVGPTRVIIAIVVHSLKVAKRVDI
jgi:hypothetical protein